MSGALPGSARCGSGGDVMCMECNHAAPVASGKPSGYVGGMSQFLLPPGGRRGITVLALALLIIGVVVLVVLLSRYVAV